MKKERNLKTVVTKVVPSDLETPVSAFIKLSQAFPKQPAFLLESVERGEQVGRYSILGFCSVELLRWKVEDGGNPLSLLDAAMKKYAQEISAPLPFPCGAFGYVSYDAVAAFEPKIPRKKNSDFPDACFAVPERLVLFDQVRNTMTLLAITDQGKEKESLGQIEKKLQGKAISPAFASALSAQSFHSSETKKSYMEKVEKAKEYIRAGEIYQVVLSQQLTGATEASPLHVYRALRVLNPSPYMFFLNFNSFQLIGSSPEMLVKVQNGTAETKPIAGSRPRGKTAEEDSRFSEELLRDPKERSEHVMLVDLGRNDLGKVCRYGTVQVTDSMEVERYSHVMHLVSTVQGVVAPEKSALDVLQAAFPAGTVSGAPKVRAMEIIAELEAARRGPYAGSVGYVGFTGNLDTCITIRTVLMKDQNVWIQAGAGIVADSNPEREYEETLNKMEGLREAVRLAENHLQMNKE